MTFLSPTYSVLTDAEMQDWWDSSPAPGRVVWHEGGNGYYIDEDTFDLGEILSANSFSDVYEPDTGGTTWDWEVNRVILALFVDGVLFFPAVSPGAGEYAYNPNNGVVTKSTNFAGEKIFILYQKIWRPPVV